MLTYGHCPPLAVFLSLPWSSMWPCVFVSVGTDEVDLPDILLPAGQYLDMFDFESDLFGASSDEELVEV